MIGERAGLSKALFPMEIGERTLRRMLRPVPAPVDERHAITKPCSPGPLCCS